MNLTARSIELRGDTQSLMNRQWSTLHPSLLRARGLLHPLTGALWVFTLRIHNEQSNGILTDDIDGIGDLAVNIPSTEKRVRFSPCTKDVSNASGPAPACSLNPQMESAISRRDSQGRDSLWTAIEADNLLQIPPLQSKPIG